MSGRDAARPGAGPRRRHDRWRSSLLRRIDAGKVTESRTRRPQAERSSAPGCNYFFACHWETKGDAAKHREYLDKALKADPTDVDVLIACYRLPDQTPEYPREDRRPDQEVGGGESASRSPKRLRQQHTCRRYNQFAWLIGNTEGDFDEALKCSQKSLELKPDKGGYYDTLARVYFAKGDLENAVKTADQGRRTGTALRPDPTPTRILPQATEEAGGEEGEEKSNRSLGTVPIGRSKVLLTLRVRLWRRPSLTRSVRSTTR